LKNINQSNLSRWYVSICANPSFINKTKQLKSILKEIDFLGFQFEQSKQYLRAEGRRTNLKGYKYSTPLLDQKRYLLEKRNKILDIYIYGSYNEKIGFLQFLDYCQSLKGLFIKTLGDPILGEFNSNKEDKDGDEDGEEGSNNEDKEWKGLKDNENSESQKKTGSNCWAKNLQNAVVCFNMINDDKDTFYPKILNILGNDCPQLKSLEFFSCNTFTWIEEFEDGTEEKKVETDINSMPGQLQNIPSLEELTLSTLKEDDNLRESIKTFQNLERLIINILPYDEACAWDDNLSFEDLGNIKELTVIIHPDSKRKEWEEI